MIDTLTGYLTNPRQYNPDKQTLRGFLARKVKEGIKNRCRSEERRQFREEKAAIVFGMEGLLSPSAAPEQRFLEEERRQILDDLIDDDADRAFLNRCLNGEQDVAKLAEALGCQDAPHPVQGLAVKQARDRIRKKLQRALQKDGG